MWLPMRKSKKKIFMSQPHTHSSHPTGCIYQCTIFIPKSVQLRNILLHIFPQFSSNNKHHEHLIKLLFWLKHRIMNSESNFYFVFCWIVFWPCTHFMVNFTLKCITIDREWAVGDISISRLNLPPQTQTHTHIYTHMRARTHTFK